MTSLIRLHLAAFLFSLATLGWPAYVHADGLAVGLEATVGETQTGLTEIGDGLSLVPLEATGGETGEAQWMLRDGSYRNGPEDAFLSGHVGGLPGLDGLNTSPEAFRNALRGLDPTVIRAVLGRIDPAILTHITQGLSAPLSGLEAETDDDAFSALPGLDGLPIHNPR